MGRCSEVSIRRVELDEIGSCLSMSKKVANGIRDDKRVDENERKTRVAISRF